MAPILAQVLPFVLLPAVATVVGGLVAVWRPPGLRLRSAIQHVAAGIVLAVVAVELLPQVMHEGQPVPAFVGFTLGIGLMLGVKGITERAEAAEEASPVASALPRGLIAASAVDVLLDGLLVGVGFAAGEKAGVLVAAALTFEVLFLGLAVASVLLRSGVRPSRIAFVVSSLAGLLVVGGLVGGVLVSTLTGALLEGVLAFGVAALLYLVTEELLTEAHEQPETPLVTAAFFVGFIVLLLVEMVL